MHPLYALTPSFTETNQTYKYAYNPKPQTFQEARHDCGIRGLTMPKTEAELTRLVDYMETVANTTNITVRYKYTFI